MPSVYAGLVRSPVQRAGQVPATPVTPTPSHWGLITAGAVEAEQQRTLASAQTTDLAVTACTALDPSLVAEWKAFLAALTAWCQTPMVNIWTPWMPTGAIVVTGDTGDTMMAWEAQLANWQQQLASACTQSTAAANANTLGSAPSVMFPPGLSQLTGPAGTTPGAPSWLCSTLGIGCESSWSDTLKWVAILGVAGIAAWYVGPLVAATVGLAAGAVKKHAGQA